VSDEVVLPVPVVGEVSLESPTGPGVCLKMEPQDYGILKMHAHNGAQRQADGASAYAENLRYDYLEGKNGVSFAESTGVRHVEESGSSRARETAAGPPANR
jgi:hypothetical protein